MSSKSRFDADKVERLASINQTGRLEIQFTDRHGHRHTVSLPSSAAVALGRLICDISENLPFLAHEPVARSKRA